MVLCHYVGAECGFLTFLDGDLQGGLFVGHRILILIIKVIIENHAFLEFPLCSHYARGGLQFIRRLEVTTFDF